MESISKNWVFKSKGAHLKFQHEQDYCRKKNHDDNRIWTTTMQLKKICILINRERNNKKTNTTLNQDPDQF